MANTLAENIRRNLANQAAVAQQFQAARSRLPGYVAPQRIAAPTPTPVKKPIIDQPPPVKIKPMPIDAPTKIIIPEEPPKKIIPEEGTIGPINLDEFEPRPQEEFVAPIDELIKPIMPTLPVEPMTGQDIMEGFAKFKEQNPGAGMGPGLQVMIYGRLPDGTPLVFGNSAQANAFNQYLESIGQPPFERSFSPVDFKDDSGEKSLMPIEEIDQIDMTRPPGTPIGMEDSPLTVMPIYNNPLPRDELLSGFEQFKKDNPEVMQGAGTAVMIPATLPGGYSYNFSGGLEANAFRKYLESIGQAPYQRRQDPEMIKKLAGGGMPTGIMRTNKAGVMERDYRDKGGFVPVGIKEKADDVPAMLSKNEFVFTADAVRGAGNGSIEKGAQRMYDTMKNLERRVT
jgi:hypothetical protein